MKLDAKVPAGPLAEKWTRFQFEAKLVNPANKRKFSVLVVGSGLAGASAAATLAELGYQVQCFCFQDSPRRARGIVVRDLVTGKVESYAADAVVLATGGYANAFFLSTNAAGSNVTATYRAFRRGAAFANPCYTQIHPTCIPVAGEHQSKLTLMSESLRNDGRVWVPKAPGDVNRYPTEIPEDDRDYYLERMYPSFG